MPLHPSLLSFSHSLPLKHAHFVFERTQRWVYRQNASIHLFAECVTSYRLLYARAQRPSNELRLFGMKFTTAHTHAHTQSAKHIISMEIKPQTKQKRIYRTTRTSEPNGNHILFVLNGDAYAMPKQCSLFSWIQCDFDAVISHLSVLINSRLIQFVIILNIIMII